MVDVTIGIGAPAPLSETDLAQRNAQINYQSEYGQGGSNALVGLAITIAGAFMNSAIIVAVGIVVILYGLSRRDRAVGVKNAADLDYARSLGAKV